MSELVVAFVVMAVFVLGMVEATVFVVMCCVGKSVDENTVSEWVSE